MKIIIIILLLVSFVLPSTLLAQNENPTDKIIFSIDFSIQKHDKRLYHWPEFPAMHLLEQTPGSFGTYQLNVSVAKRVFKYKKIDVLVGLGLGIEKAFFYRPFHHTYLKNGGTKIIRYTDRYYQSLLQVPFKLKYNFNKKWKLLLEVLPQFNFYTAANNSRSLDGSNNYSWWGFHFYAVEVNSGIEYSVDKFNFGLKFRAFQFKKIDPILFWSTSSFVIEDTYEIYNPFKIWLSVGYKF